MTASAGQTGLDGCRPDTTERMDDGQADVPREIGGLIEPALAPPRRVQGHGHGSLGTRQHQVAAGLHQHS